MADTITLRTQDGAHFLTAELDGTISATRTEAGPWEHWEVLPDVFGQPNVRVLKSAHGLHLSAYTDEYCAERGLPQYTAMASAEHPDAWERWVYSVDGDIVRLQSAQTGRWLSPQNVEPNPQAGGAGVLCNGPQAAGWETFFPSSMAPFGGVTRPPGLAARPLQGRVRIIGRSFGDDTGPRIVHGCSDFGALVKFHEDRGLACADLDRVAASGRQYVRVLFRLNGWYWGGGPGYESSGLTVDPIRDPWFDEALRGYLEACRDRGLKVNLSSGDFYNWTNDQARESFQRVADIASSVSPDVVWLLAVANEMRGVWPDGESDENIAFAAELLEQFTARYPGALLAVSDPGSQDRDGMKRLTPHPANVSLIHDVRWYTNDALRRAFNTIYENFPGHPVCQDEPTGPNGFKPKPFGQNVWQPIDDSDDLLAIYTMHVLTGQASTYFGDPSLVSREPLDIGYGLNELPIAWAEMGIPEDIGQGDIKPGHHDDSPLQVVNSHAERADGMIAPGGAGFWGVISGGDNWQVRSGWDGQLTAWTGAGVVHEGHVSTGQVVPIGGPTPTVVRIVR